MTRKELCKILSDEVDMLIGPLTQQTLNANIVDMLGRIYMAHEALKIHADQKYTEHEGVLP